jgi:hypothetical protein
VAVWLTLPPYCIEPAVPIRFYAMIVLLSLLLIVPQDEEILIDCSGPI